MFLGFFSRRTFKGFCSSYVRYCVRSYIRNIWDYQDKMRKLEKDYSEGRPLPKARGARGLGSGVSRGGDTSTSSLPESPRELVARISQATERAHRHDGWTDKQIGDNAEIACRAALMSLAEQRGLPSNFYIEGFDTPAICHHRGGPLAGFRANGTRILSSAPASARPAAIRPNGGLRGGVMGKVRY